MLKITVQHPISQCLSGGFKDDSFFRQRLNYVLWYKAPQDVWKVLKLDFDQLRKDGSTRYSTA